MRRLVLTTAVLAALATTAVAHHGWGSYDAGKKLSIEAAVESLSWQNPHAHVMLKHQDATWEVTLAPVSRMARRGLSEDMLKSGTMIVAEGYPSTRNDHEMRAERITVGGKVFEMR